MAYTAKQWRAIKWYSQANQLKPQLSAFPNLRFLRADGQILQWPISDIVLWYEAHLKQQAAERAKRRRAEARKATR